MARTTGQFIVEIAEVRRSKVNRVKMGHESSLVCAERCRGRLRTTSDDSLAGPARFACRSTARRARRPADDRRAVRPSAARYPQRPMFARTNTNLERNSPRAIHHPETGLADATPQPHAGAADLDLYRATTIRPSGLPSTGRPVLRPSTSCNRGSSSNVTSVKASENFDERVNWPRAHFNVDRLQ
jgi:hypothetical protein